MRVRSQGEKQSGLSERLASVCLSVRVLKFVGFSNGVCEGLCKGGEAVEGLGRCQRVVFVALS